MFQVLALLSFLICFNSNAATLTFSVVTPPKPLNWFSPRTLSMTTARNSLARDMAPIGHISISLQCETKNEYGVSSVSTGMSRASRKTSQKIVTREKLGLASMLYDFEGALDTAKNVEAENRLAAKAGRLGQIQLLISESTCQESLRFLKFWIESGSFRHYGGKFDPKTGGGSGCAAFGVQFLKMAKFAIPESESNKINARGWLRNVIIPHALYGDRRIYSVNFLRLAFTHLPWATTTELGVPYSTYDPELVFDWIYSQAPNGVVEQDLRNMATGYSTYSTERFYEEESEDTVKAIWDSIKVPSALPTLTE